MPRITPGNRLYLYSLFSREIGVGKQTMISRVEEVLLADDIMPCDLACDSTRELLEQLDEFVRLTVFKKGRVYATIDFDNTHYHAEGFDFDCCISFKGLPPGTDELSVLIASNNRHERELSKLLQTRD